MGKQKKQTMSESFEKQVKDILDDLAFEPGAGVWQEVRHSLQPDRKKRRFVYWWVLPLVLGVAGLLYQFNGNDRQTITGKSNDGTERRSKNPGKDAAGDFGSTEQYEPSAQIMIPGPVTERETQREFYAAAKRQTTANRRITTTSSAVSTIEADSKTSATVVPANESREQSDPIAARDANAGSPAGPSPVSAPQMQDTASRMNVAVTDSGETSQTVVSQKKKQSNSWRFGIAAEVGLVTQVKGLNLESAESLTKEIISPPSGPLTSGGPPTTLKHSSSVIAKEIWGLALVAEKPLRNNFRFRGAVGYQKLATATTFTTYKDSLMSGSLSAVTLHQERLQQRLHLLTAYTGVQVTVYKFTGVQFGLGAGLHNKFILGGQSTTTGHNYVLNQQTTSTHRSKGYQPWQPHLALQLVADITTQNGSVIQVTPFLEYGLNRFEKAGAKKHLASFGIQVAYFLR